jgi:hypothetical protein
MGEIRFQGTIGEQGILPEVVKEFTKDAKAGIFSVMFAGNAANLNEYHVQINNGPDGYSSDWPEWAYNIAKEAILHNKRIWVIYKDVPFGFNLLQVHIFHQ